MEFSYIRVIKIKEIQVLLNDITELWIININYPYHKKSVYSLIVHRKYQIIHIFNTINEKSKGKIERYVPIRHTEIPKSIWNREWKINFYL